MVYESSKNYKIGFWIDFWKYALALIGLFYAYVYSKAKIVGLALPLEAKLSFQAFNEVFIYFGVLGLLTLIATGIDRLLGSIDFTPTYSNAFNKNILSIALIIAISLLLGTMVGGVKVGEVVPYNPLNPIETGIINSLKAIIENGFFIHFLGFSIWTFLSGGVTKRNKFTAFVASLIVGGIAMLWHIYKISVIYHIAAGVAPLAAIQYFVFFAVMSFLSFLSDSVWPADIIHVANNFALAVFGRTAYVIL